MTHKFYWNYVSYLLIIKFSGHDCQNRESFRVPRYNVSYMLINNAWQTKDEVHDSLYTPQRVNCTKLNRATAQRGKM